MQRQSITVINPTGLHLRPAGLLCQEAMKFSSKVGFLYGPEKKGEANCKSILSILGACIRAGDEITVVCEGDDEVEAMSSIITLIMDGLGDVML